MVSVGDAALDFTAPLTDIDDDIESFTFSESLDDASIVLALFPAAFTGTYTTEMYTFYDQMTNFEDVGATVYGINIDMPLMLTKFAEQNDLDFGLTGDANREFADTCDMAMDFVGLDVNRMAKRAVSIVDGDDKVIYA